MDRVYICMYMYISTYVYMYAFINVYMYISDGLILKANRFYL